jgi:hypothetical protein
MTHQEALSVGDNSKMVHSPDFYLTGLSALLDTTTAAEETDFTFIYSQSKNIFLYSYFVLKCNLHTINIQIYHVQSLSCSFYSLTIFTPI